MRHAGFEGQVLLLARGIPELRSHRGLPGVRRHAQKKLSVGVGRFPDRPLNGVRPAQDDGCGRNRNEPGVVQNRDRERGPIAALDLPRRRLLPRLRRLRDLCHEGRGGEGKQDGGEERSRSS